MSELVKEAFAARVASTQVAEVRPELPEIVERYLAGESITVLAKECGVARRTIYNWMLSGLGDKAYAELVTQCLVNRVSDADEQLELATDPVEVSKWRDVSRFSRMDFERRRPNLYGQKPVNVNVVNVGQDAGLIASMEDLLGRVAEPKLIESEE